MWHVEFCIRKTRADGGAETLPRKRLRVIYSGRVQGVGFRFTCERLATAFPVVGYVRNLPDRSVELLADGDSVAVDAFLAAVDVAMGRKIHDISVSTEEPPEVREDAFIIRY